MNKISPKIKFIQIEHYFKAIFFFFTINWEFLKCKSKMYLIIITRIIDNSNK